MSNGLGAGRQGYRKKLLTSVSAVALTTFVYSAGCAAAADGDRPPLWIEAGWHFDRVGGGNELFGPPFVDTMPAGGLTSPFILERAMSYAYGGDGRISFQPDGSDWIFSASVRYGRSHSRKQIHEEKELPSSKFYLLGKYGTATPMPNFDDISASNRENYAIADFQVGRDVGLGILGDGNVSTLGVGIRFAQFNSGSDSTIYARADSHFVPVPFVFGSKYGSFPANFHHTYRAHSHMERNFHGVGPSISWKNATALLGEPQEGELTLDWGVNAAILIGRQKASGHHDTTVNYYYQNPKYAHTSSYTAANPKHGRNVIVPNVGGTLGVSYRIEDFKVSLGYRADVFFNAIDGGIDARKTYNRGFYGPFASISIGVGD